jgi:hypothetical protein
MNFKSYAECHLSCVAIKFIMLSVNILIVEVHTFGVSAWSRSIPWSDATGNSYCRGRRVITN